MHLSLLAQLSATLRQPIALAIIASALCAFGISRVVGSCNASRIQKQSRNAKKMDAPLTTNTRDDRWREIKKRDYRVRSVPNNASERSTGKRSNFELNGRLVSRFSGRGILGNFLKNEQPLPSEFHLIKRLSNALVVGLCVASIVFLFTGSLAITFPFTCLSIAFAWILLKNRETREEKAILQAWPEVVDHLISGIQSGMSLLEAMASLSIRGPEIIRKDFQTFKEEILSTGDFSRAVENLKVKFHSQASDQILEAILMAKLMGGSELLEIFRTLGDFIRQDLALRKEIEIKHGWIKNSAHLSSVAPWLLLLLLSSQPGTVESYSQPGGIAILFLGLAMTFIAYLWMGKLSKLPEPPRVFGFSIIQTGSKEWSR